MSLTLLYFNINGLAARIRLACAVGGVALKDHRFSDRAEFTAMKAAGELPFGQVPCLLITEKDGTITKLAQSSAILRFVCSLGGLLPTDPVVAARVDAAVAAEGDAFSSFGAISYPARNGLDHLDAAALEKAFENHRAEVIVRRFFLRKCFPRAPAHGFPYPLSPPAAAPPGVSGKVSRGQRHRVGVRHRRAVACGLCVGHAPLRCECGRRCQLTSRNAGAVPTHQRVFDKVPLSG